MLETAFFLIFVCLVLSFLNMRLGIYAILFIGFLQDPLRKLVPGEPVYMSVLVVIFAFATYMGGRMQHTMLRLDTVPEWQQRLKSISLVFLVLILLQCMAAFAYTGSLFLAGIGFMAYLSPFPALQLSYSFANRSERIVAFLRLYLLINALMCAGVYLSQMGIDWTVLHTVGEDLIVYSLEGSAIALPAGFYRTPELAAWHCASGACIALALGLSSRRQTTLWSHGLLAVFFVGAVLLSGRRKFLVEIVVFLPVFLFFLYRLRLASTKFLSGVALAALVGVGLATSGIASDDTIANFRDASARGEARDESMAEELLGRVHLMTVQSLPYVIEQNGFFGSGAGSGSQGAQYFGGGSDLVGLAAEGGLGKVLAELGVPGLLVLLALGFTLVAYVWQTLKLVSKHSPRIANLTAGLTAFLIANGIVFVTAAQAFGDLFVLLILGFMLGFIIAIRRLVQASINAQASASAMAQPRDLRGEAERT